MIILIVFWRSKQEHYLCPAGFLDTKEPRADCTSRIDFFPIFFIFVCLLDAFIEGRMIAPMGILILGGFVFSLSLPLLFDWDQEQS